MVCFSKGVHHGEASHQTFILSAGTRTFPLLQTLSGEKNQFMAALKQEGSPPSYCQLKKEQSLGSTSSPGTALQHENGQRSHVGVFDADMSCLEVKSFDSCGCTS